MFSGERAITVRALGESDWRTFREIRLSALEMEPGVYFSTLGAERTKTDADWQSMVIDPTLQIFGLFDGTTLVGITGVFTFRDDPSGATAMFGMSFVLPEYRGRGLAEKLFDARLKWVAAHPQFKRIIVSHRASNEAARRANQRHGFRFLKRVSREWPDGSAEDEIVYELEVGSADR